MMGIKVRQDRLEAQDCAWSTQGETHSYIFLFAGFLIFVAESWVLSHLAVGSGTTNVFSHVI